MDPLMRLMLGTIVMAAVACQAHPQGPNEQVGEGGIPTHASDGTILTDEQKAALQQFYDQVEGVFGGGGGGGDAKEDDGGFSGLIERCEPFDSYDCVPYFQCGPDGSIISDGGGLIDVRIRPQGTCINKEYPDVPALCCLLPGAKPHLDECTFNSECVDPYSCNSKGEIVTDGSGVIDIRAGQQQCYQPDGQNGVCCSFPKAPVLEYCPGNSACVPDKCVGGQALDAFDQFIDYVPHVEWQECALQHGNTGICCNKPIITHCPDSKCVAYGSCDGTAMDTHGSFIDYDAFLSSWSECDLGVGHADTGVCCITKAPILHPAGKCGVRNYHIDQRIQSNYAANEAAFGEFPWQSIIFFQNYTYKCGASLISNEHAITGAHCVQGLKPSDIRLRFGEWQVDNFGEPLPYQDKNVKEIYVHSQFNPKNLHNDIAVLHLSSPIPLEYNINTVCLPGPHDDFYEGDDCFATGWGKDSFTGNFQTILKKISLPFVEHQRCQTLLRKTRLGRFFRLDNSFNCAGGIANEDACYGDGGGPLVCKSPSTGQYLLAGITAWGIGCGEQNVPGVYVDVKQFSSWVDDIVLGKPGQTPHVGPVSNYGK